MKRTTGVRWSGVLAAAMAAGLPAMGLAAVSPTWQAVGGVYGGDFSTSGHWSGGVVPSNSDASTGDTANFNVNQTYSVTFAGSPGSKQAIVDGGNVTFDLSSGGYTTSAAGTGASASLIAGKSSTAALTVSGGTATNILTSGTATVGYLAGSSGTVTVTGANSAWSINGTFEVGYFGTGVFNVENGGTVTNSTAVTMGHVAGGNGSATVKDKNSNWIFGNLALGNAANSSGAILVEDQGAATSGSVHLGANGTGKITVTGTNSTFTGKTYIRVGESGNGTLLVEDGGKLFSNGNRNESVYYNSIGAASGGTGIATVTGAGSQWTNKQSLYLGGNFDGVGGTGSLTIDSGGLVSVATAPAASTPALLQIYNTGTLNLGGSSALAAPTVNSAGGTINISHAGNTITGNVVLDGNTTTSVLLSGDSDFAQLSVSGDMGFGGTLDVLLDTTTNYHPSNGDSYDLFNWGTNLTSSQFASIILPGLDSGLAWNTDDLYSTGVIRVSMVPEPATLGLLGLGLCGMMLKRRRK